ncbi:Phytanoyl-CoA dioxygenase domain-containing protein 1 [Orchesella cincta]|uniref:Phytanoyl-CoA dioxygenase domain-containing protein 1 n=1 Tax=Orchesella cincta TaxID=48709 RepID=A0A1D2NMK1_ORCCI|nr:Phytanoyl-CoA dioxygenase domain-containing protein 1 [Orchesella cincta]
MIFRENGFAVVPGFLSLEEVLELKKATNEVLQQYCQNLPVSVFKSSKSTESRDRYFADSGDKIRGFFEESTVSPDGKLLVDKPEDGLNKVGHALHKFHPKFNELTINGRVKEIAEKLSDIEEPTVMQSMVIFKHPKVGGEDTIVVHFKPLLIVKPHQDATYLHTEPSYRKLIGFWIALDEASLENGCLHFAPGSHKPQKIYQRQDDESAVNFKSNLIFTGDLVLIDGLVIHQSEPNSSDKRRMAYTFHVVDGKAKWSDQNWLQPTEEGTFMRI